MKKTRTRTTTRMRTRTGTRTRTDDDDESKMKTKTKTYLPECHLIARKGPRPDEGATTGGTIGSVTLRR